MKEKGIKKNEINKEFLKWDKEFPERKMNNGIFHWREHKVVDNYSFILKALV